MRKGRLFSANGVAVRSQHLLPMKRNANCNNKSEKKARNNGNASVVSIWGKSANLKLLYSSNAAKKHCVACPRFPS
jgi:hypothetical protein